MGSEHRLTWRQASERPVLVDNHLATSIDAVDLKDRLGDVETDCRDRLHVGLL